MTTLHSITRLLQPEIFLVPLTFQQADVAASQSDVQLSVSAVDNAADDQLAVVGYTTPWPGTVVGLSVDLSAAASAGTLTVGPTVNGTEQGAPTATITTAASTYAYGRRGRAPFNEGDVLGAEITTDGSWNGTSADLTVTLWALVDLADAAEDALI